MILRQLFIPMEPVKPPYVRKGFQGGGLWMQEKLNELTNSSHTSVPNFVFLGVLKYAISVFIGLLLFLLCAPNTPLGTLLFILGFYGTEVHFLFIFPLAIEGKKPLFFQSICLTYKTGIIKSFFTTVFIAGFMLVGLLNFKNPFANWYKGCYVILNWYVDVRDW